MKKEPNFGRDLPVRVTICAALGSIAMVLFICIFVDFGFNTLVGREAVYLSALFAICNIIMIHYREHRWAAYFPAMSRGMRHFRAVVNGSWLLGLLLLLASGVLLLCQVSLVAFWSQFTVLAGYLLTLLGWWGNLMAYHRRRTAARMVAEEQQEARFRAKD